MRIVARDARTRPRTAAEARERPTPQDEQLRRRLKNALKAAYEANGGVEDRLLNKIKQANDSREYMTIERRKLHDLLFTDKHVKLTTLELQALDTFFLKAGKGGLSGIFKRNDILRLVANTGRVVFLLGTKSYGQADASRESISSWDLRSVVHIMRSMDSISPGTLFDMHEVVLRTRGQLATPNEPLATFEQEAWHNLITQRSGPSIISLGSPRANHGSERLLAEMMGFTPFTTNGSSGEANREPPFRFAWKPDEIERVPSRYVVQMADLVRSSHLDPKKFYAAVRIENERNEQKVYTSEFRSDVRYDYGIAVCQRRPDQRIFMCLSGLTGPSTYAAAQVIASASLELPFDDSPHPPALWALVKTQVRVQKDITGNIRVPNTDEEPVAVGVWHPVDHAG